ncbi:hypothetical protein AJ80_06141 [Polytolypa hystricis UAMH7299]|uniref:Uncharacterized protein n=1 Tax=Polytolypa hystricis (strain UAMH7299) TaxID=1447883 RepID=A0A2B7XZ16_POLH7|nr:hypothetical protein AJ80_06141 [Polytolypa hystricis UAMH7299]
MVAASQPSTLSHLRPAIYLVAGVAAAYAVLFLHTQYASTSSHSHSELRRRGAIRRSSPRRRGGISLPSGESRDGPDFSGPIRQLDLVEREQRDYGVFKIDMGDGHTIDCRLIPSEFLTIEQLQGEFGFPEDRALSIRAILEEVFLSYFFTTEYLPTHTIRQETGEWQFLVDEFTQRGLAEENITKAIKKFNEDQSWDEVQQRGNEEGVILPVHTNGSGEQGATQPDGGETTVDEQSVFSWREGNDEGTPTREGQNLLNLLYYIAEDQARRDGYIHRGVTCNSCGAMPIQGIRYRCANCLDYDLCETCEAMQVHIKTHLFYKVRIPAPFLGSPRQTQPVWYPGKPSMLPRNLPRPLAKRLMKETNFENTELDALWDQFRCLANVEWPTDPNKLSMAIDRKTFDRCFVPNTSIRPPPPSLIYDRMFSFYDTNGDDLIGFEEFLKGLASFSNKSVHERLRRIFDGYDMDKDGYVERKDFLRIFRAYYTLSRELTRDMVAGMEDDFLEGSTRDIVMGSQPISAAFPSSIPTGEPSRIGEGKRTNLQGDMEIIDNGGILREDGDDRGDRNVVIGDAVVRETYSRARTLREARHLLPAESRRLPRQVHTDNEDEDEDEEDEDEEGYGFDVDLAGYEEWPPNEDIEVEDIATALGAYVPLEEVTDRVDRARIGTAAMHRLDAEDAQRMQQARRDGVHERWARREFYLDEEEGATAPPGYHDEDEETQEEAIDDDTHHDDTQSDSHVPPSPRSRSSSKVRFQDDVTDNEYETRSNTSSRSIPVAERWGGFEIPEVEKDAGKEVLYHVTQQGLNELLDLIFKSKEDALMEAHRTRKERKRWAKETKAFVESLPDDHRLKREDSMYQDEDEDEDAAREKKAHETNLLNLANMTFDPRRSVDKPLEQLLNEAGYSIVQEEDEEEVGEQPTSPNPENIDLHGGINYSPLASESASDPTLPQNRPDESDVEPFPPVPHSPEATYNEYYDVTAVEAHFTPSSLSPPPDPTLPQNRPETTSGRFGPREPGRSLHITDVSGSTTLPEGHTILDQSPIYESPSTSASASATGAAGPSSSSTRPRNHSLPLRLRFQQQQNQPQDSRESPSPIVSVPASTTSTASSSHNKPPSSAAAVRSPSPPPPLPSSSSSSSRPPSRKTIAHWCKLNQAEREARERGGSGAKLSFGEFVMKMQGDRGRQLGFVGSWIDMTSF